MGCARSRASPSWCERARQYRVPMDEGLPIAYQVLEQGVPVYSSDGEQLGSVDHVVAAPDEDIFHGVVMRAGQERRFIAADHDRVASRARRRSPHRRCGGREPAPAGGRRRAGFPRARAGRQAEPLEEPRRHGQRRPSPSSGLGQGEVGGRVYRERGGAWRCLAVRRGGCRAARRGGCGLRGVAGAGCAAWRVRAGAACGGRSFFERESFRPRLRLSSDGNTIRHTVRELRPHFLGPPGGLRRIWVLPGGFKGCRGGAARGRRRTPTGRRRWRSRPTEMALQAHDDG